MPNEENTQQVNQANDNSNDSSTIRALDARVSTLEEIILARLNDTRPFEHKMMARLDELAASVAVMHEGLATVLHQQAAMREEQAAMREDLSQFRQDTNQNFRLINQKLGHLNNDFLGIRAEHTLLEKRVSILEERST